MARSLLWLLIFCSSTISVLAAPIPREEVPEPLQPWIPWVLHGEEQMACPSPYNSAGVWECRWPSGLSLTLDETRGTFRQDWRMLIQGWVTLPGNKKQWPQAVRLNGEETVVVDRGGSPAIYVEKGNHVIEGRFEWPRLPEFLQIEPRTALISLQLQGQAVALPDVDSEGRLWLRKEDTGIAATGGDEDRLDLKVFRRIVDEIPLSQVIRIELDVAGRPREVLLGQGLPAGYLPVSLRSPLPARIEPDGRVRVQIRPGNWVLELVCRHSGPASEIASARAPDPWPPQEVWVFDARNHLRLVAIEGGTPIDPQQTTMPPEWRNLPAYRLMPGEALRLVEKRRGDPDPAPDQLMLHRNIWLDFSGEGYTVQDRINGTMTRGWRLEMLPPASLGQVTVDGVPQFITRLEESGKEGVEVRRGQIRLVADSRVSKGSRTMPAVGWDHDFQQVEALLHLPPGWRLFSATGVDDVPGTWLKRWTLLDLFVVLIIALSVGKLWGPGWGVVALVALALCYHEPFAPRFVWLHVLFAEALLRVLPRNRFSRLVTLYRNGAMIALVLIALPFMVDQVRKGIFPQL
ncbi:MAG: hypothetical protein R3231_10655, partial [bacterium]|nr:hypothetical protein [bacterium]